MLEYPLYNALCTRRYIPMTTQTATQTTIIYPESDGQPMPDGTDHSLIFRRVLTPLENHFGKIPGSYVNGNTFLYYVEGDPGRSVSPDCYVVLDITPEAIHSLSAAGNNTYLLWEVGKPPEFVIEIASESTKSNDLIGKRALYASLGISEYWRYDPTGGDHYGDPLVGERLVNGEYERIHMREDDDGRIWASSIALNLDIYWDDGELRYWDPVAEKWLLNYEEEHAALLVAESRAEVAEDRANQEQAARLAEQTAREIAESRAEQEQAGRLAAEARAAALEAQLRQLRGNPNPPPSP